MKNGTLLFGCLLLALHAAAVESMRPAGAADGDDPQVIAGFQAIFTCGARFNAARPLAAILREELADVAPQLPRPLVIADAGIVTTRTPQGQERIAAWRPGMGCTLLPPGATRSDVVNLPFVMQPHPGFDPTLTEWPQGDLMDPPAPHDALDKVVTAAFDPGIQEGEPFTIGVVVVADDRIVAERYRDGFDPWSGYRTWSTAKSFTQALVGTLVQSGALQLDAPAPIPEWQHVDDPRVGITLRHLLQMSSGLASEGANSNAVYFGGQDVLSAATTTELEHAPGEHFRYANNDTLLLLRAIRHVLDDDLAYLRLPNSALFHPLGMTSTVMETDHRGNFIGSSQVYTTARDLARFGLLYLHDGNFDGRRILPEGWAELARTRAPAHEPQELPGGGFMGYGHHFWRFEGVPGVPDGTYTTAGHKGQFSTVVPSKGVVIVRTGIDPDGTRWDQASFVARVLAALEADEP